MRTQRVAIGLGLVGLSGVTIYGGVTGRLAPMLGAVFAPGTLTPPEAPPHPSVLAKVLDTGRKIILPPGMGDLVNKVAHAIGLP